jgi:hypothetical protein
MFPRKLSEIRKVAGGVRCNVVRVRFRSWGSRLRPISHHHTRFVIIVSSRRNINEHCVKHAVGYLFLTSALVSPSVAPAPLHIGLAPALSARYEQEEILIPVQFRTLVVQPAGARYYTDSSIPAHVCVYKTGG